MPTVSMQSPTCCGVRSSGTPRASTTSALPHWLETERLPCLATFTPAPATTKAVVVETLNVLVPSPPVPHVSTTVSASTLISSRSRATFEFPTGMGTLFARITRAAPTISSVFTPFMRSPIRNAPICAGVAFPSVIWSMTSIISDSERSCRCTTLAMAC